MKTLEDIKEEYARENNFCEWSEILYSIDDPAEIDEHFDKVANLYALEASKETQKKRCAQNATTEQGCYSDGSAAPIRVVDKYSIISESNIPQELRNINLSNG